jgi:hypothetical protein
MAIRNPYSEFSRRGDEVDERQALLDALDEPQPPPMQARPRTPTRTPEQTREMLSSPGGRTQSFLDPREAAEIGRNAYSGTPSQDVDTPPVYTPPSTTSTQPPAGSESPSNMSRGYQLMDEYDDPYTRRNEGAGGALSNGARWAQTGATVGSVVPGVGTLVGGVVGGLAGLIGGAFTKNAESAMTDFSVDDARAIISAAHKDAFGRDITPEYLDEILQGQGWRPGHEWFGEAPLAYVLDQFASQAPADRAATAAANAAAANQGASTANQGGAQGALGDYARNLEGFAMGRFADPSGQGNNTIKYQVGRVLSRHAPNAEGLAAAAEELRGMGIDVTQGGKNGDLLVFGNEVVDDQGNAIGTIDVGRGFGASGSGWAWQPQGGGGGGAAGDAPGDIQGAYAYLKSIAHPGMSRAEMESAITQAFGNVPGFERGYAGDVVINGKKIDLVTDFEGANPQWSDNLSFVPLHGGGTSASAGGGAMTGGPNLAPGAQLAAPLGRSDVLAQIQAELDRLLRGEPPRDELLEALG